MKNAQEIAYAYLSYCRDESPETEWAFDTVQDLEFDNRWEDVWQIIVAIARHREELETEALAVVAAGPLENLVCQAGLDFIDRVEEEAKFNHQFGRMLTGVWLYSAEPEVRERVVKFCRAFPNPIDEKYAF